MIYFVQNMENHWVKIGFSKTPSFRLKCLRSRLKVDIELLGVIPGSKRDEKALHALFEHRWVEGEWFEPAGSFMLEIMSMIKELGVPIGSPELVPMQIMVPIDLATKVRERAGRERASLSRFGTEALSKHLGIDPAEYGIEAEKQSA